MGDRVSAAQAAFIVRRHERIVRTHIANGSLPAEKAGGTWQIDTDDLARVPGWHVDAARLAELRAQGERSVSAILARLDALERENRDLRARLRALEQRSTGSSISADAGGDRGKLPTSLTEGRQPSLGEIGLGIGVDAPETRYDLLGASQGHSGQGIGLSPDARHILSDLSGAYHGPRTVTLADRGAGAPLSFTTKTAAARWLSRHGINETTPKTWQGWPPAELTPASVFAFALELQRQARVSGNWRVSWSLRPCDDGACVCRDMLAEG